MFNKILLKDGQTIQDLIAFFDDRYQTDAVGVWIELMSERVAEGNTQKSDFCCAEDIF